MEISEELAEQAQPIIQAFQIKLVELIKANRGHVQNSDKVLKVLKEPGKLLPAISTFPFDERLELNLYAGDLDKLKEVVPIYCSVQLTDDLIQSVTPADYRTLCEYLLKQAITLWEKKLAEATPEYLASNFNDNFTQEESLRAQLIRSEDSLRFFEQQDSEVDMRDVIK